MAAIDDRDHAGLIELARDGDEIALGRLYEMYSSTLLGYLTVLLRDPHEAEDAVHQVFLKARRALRTYRELGGDSFERWLFRIARNHAIDVQRRGKRLDVLDPSVLGRFREAADAAPDERLGEWVSQPEVRELIDELPPTQHRVITLRYLFGCSHAESARILGTTEASVRQSHHLALRKLALELEALRPPPASKGRCQKQAMRRFAVRRRTPRSGFTLLSSPVRRFAA